MVVKALFKIAEFAALFGATLWIGGRALESGKDLINGRW